VPTIREQVIPLPVGFRQKAVAELVGGGAGLVGPLKVEADFSRVELGLDTGLLFGGKVLIIGIART